ncbi:hypothetical protein C4D60_Mb11t15760 [Musa balbisiana]|uniref:Xyloglucan endotransglucosylase/hydrolase n=1 Tax=Musa balbisiana TaxID=52838 RepID=A0A4S8J5Y3_MUSBA|nr:hypothetical protein C4D60_Mb11t15760 [Musa balbisiana]
MAMISAVVLLSCVVTVTAAFDVTAVPFDEGFSHLFGNDNLVRSSDGRTARLTLNRYSGSGFVSNDMYHHGFFSASIKLPSDYTAGVVVAFYTSNGDLFEKTHDELDFEFLGNTSNGDLFEKTHDELDFEFLGNVRGKAWRIQTNVYGNGSTSRGREERYPMSVYATIWDGSTWATGNGKYKVNYKYEPFVSDFSDLVLRGCRADPIQQVDSAAARRCAEANDELLAADFALMTPKKRAAMRRFRERYMTYSFCYDTNRYPVAFPDCDIIPSEQSRFYEWGQSKDPRERRRSRRQSRKARAGDPKRVSSL